MDFEKIINRNSFTTNYFWDLDFSHYKISKSLAKMLFSFIGTRSNFHLKNSNDLFNKKIDSKMENISLVPINLKS